MARWMVTAKGLDRLARPKEPSWGPEGWRYEDSKAAFLRLNDLEPYAMASVETFGAPGEQDPVTIEFCVDAEDAARAELRAQELLADAYLYVEFTSYASARGCGPDA